MSIGLGRHPTSHVSTHPSFYSVSQPLSKTFSKYDTFNCFERTSIGHDVWIGESALVVDGVKISTGAIIAAGAVVTKDVPAYAIVAGVPARVIKYRFSEETREDNFGEKIEASLRELGLLGEKATKDIIEICKMKHKDYRAEFADIIFEYSKQVNETPKIIKQRIRRSVKSGLSNLASLGIEDYMNEIFVKYSNSVYNFQSVKHEMDFIRNKQSTSGKCNTNKFLESLIYINQIK